MFVALLVILSSFSVISGKKNIFFRIYVHYSIGYFIHL